MKMNHLIKKAAALLLAVAMLPVSALAVTEDTVIDVPDVTLDTIDTAAATVSYLPDASYYADYGDYQPEWANSDEYVELPNDGEWFTTGDLMREPWLTAGEQRRAVHLQEQYEKGEIAYTGESVLNKMTDVIVGVYALNPDDYDGETMFVLLPVCCLSDDMLLAIIDAFHQAGQPFDPAALNYRNCMRGGGIEASRLLTDEERERSTEIRLLISRGMITGEQAENVGVPFVPALDPFYHCGLDLFTFRPYRQLTDLEIAAICFSEGAQAFDNGKMSFDDTERCARRIISQAIKMPLGMNIRFVSPLTFSVSYTLDGNGNVQQISESENADGCLIGFDWIDADLFGQIQVMGYVQDGDLIPERIRWLADYSFLVEWADGKSDVNASESYVDRARIWAADKMLIPEHDDLNWSITGENVPYLAADCTVVTALTDKWIIQVMVCRDSLKVCDVELYRR